MIRARSAAIRAAPVHDLLNPRKLKHLCEDVATAEAAAVSSRFALNSESLLHSGQLRLFASARPVL